MKDFILIAVIFLLGVLLVMSKCNKDPELVDNSEQLNELKQERDNLKSQVVTSKTIIDSLEKARAEAKVKIVYRERQIDESVAEDSTNAILQLRQSLRENNELLWYSGKEPLDYREITLSSKYVAQVPKLKLQLDISQDIINLKDDIISNHQFIQKGYEQSLDIHKLETKKWKGLAERRDSFSDDRVIAYGGVGVSYSADGKLQPTVQLGIGFRLFTIWREQ